MVFVYALIIWASPGTISGPVHMFFVWRSLSGREGAESAVITRTHAARAGGMRRWITINLANDMLMPWLTARGLLISCRGE
jgi:hypothetical protein